MYFQSQGYEIFHADMGKDGIELARSRLPNLILLDIMLPDMEGFEVGKALREKNLTKYIPIIFLTQKNARADKIAGLEIGADDYITKPFDVEELRLRVKGSIERATRDHIHEPVTGLPSGPMVEAEYQNYMQKGGGWHRLDVRVNGFKGFRDAYGFLTANDALSLAAKILSDGLSEYGSDNDFIGTTAEGQFAILTFADDVKKLADTVRDEFAERSQMLYKFTDIDQGFVVMEDGEKEPLMHFTIDIQAPIAD
jgi:CheY-like chemotaxis protein